MATDATGTPTALGIPKFNTSVDAPSGLGSNAQMDSIDALIQLRAPLASPTLTGTPSAPTPVTSDNTTKIATTAFVQNFVAAGIAGVTSFNGRTGVVTPTTGDYAVANITGAAPLASPTLTGTPAAPTPATADNSTTIATTAYVKTNLASYATLASPTLTGVPLSVTPATADNSTKIATTAYVKAQGYGVGTLTSFNGRGTAAVVPTSGDYTAAQVTNAFDKGSASAQLVTGNAPFGYGTGSGQAVTQIILSFYRSYREPPDGNNYHLYIRTCRRPTGFLHCELFCMCRHRYSCSFVGDYRIVGSNSHSLLPGRNRWLHYQLLQPGWT
jgi:hypothetical protein